MVKEDFFSRKLKDLDVFKRLPKELSKGSLFGVLSKSTNLDIQKLQIYLTL